MKKAKQIISLILVLAMILNLNLPTVSVFAQDGTETVVNNEAEVSTEAKEKQNEPDKEVSGESGTESEKSDSTSETTEGTETKPADNVVEKATEKQAGEDTEKNAENGKTKETAEETLEEDALPLGGPAFRKVNREAEDITAKINKSRPDVYRVTEKNDKIDIIKDGVVVDKPYELASGHKVEFYYKWNIPHESMKGLQEGDFFYIDLPEFKFLKLFGIKPNEKHPISSLDNPDETLGFFQVETGAKNRAKLTLNETAVKKYEIRDGYLMLRFRVHVKETLKFVPSSETVEGVVITEVPKSNQNKLIGNQAYRPDTKINKGGASYDDASDNNKTKIEWNMYVNYKNLPLSLAGRLVDEKKEVWVEDDLNGTGMKIDPDTIRIYTAIYVPVNENADPKHQDAVISTDAVFWPSRQAHDFGVPNSGETYEQYRDRFKNSFATMQPFTVAVYPRDTGDAILYYLGDLSGDKTISYSDFRPGDKIDPNDPTKSKTLEREALNRLDNYLKEGKITQKQYDGAKELYGIDGNDQTKMKKMVAFHLRFASVRDKSGLVKNTATVNWHRGQASANTSLYYSAGAAGAGYNEVTAIGVTKNWERKVGGPVTMQLWDETEDGKHKLIDFIKLGVKNPNPANFETDKWSHNFNDLPKFKRVLEGTSSVMKPIKYVVREKMSPEDVANFTSTLVDDNDDTQFTFNNKNTETVKVRVNKTWVPAGQVPQGVDSVKVNVVENNTNEIVLRDQLIFAADGWTKEFTVPKYNTNMEEASYTVVEVSDIPGYESQILADSANKSVTIYNIPTITFDVTKIWKGPRTEVTLILKRGNDEIKRVTLNGDSNAAQWTHTFTGLPMYDKNGSEYTYTVEEEALPNYSNKVEGDQIIGFTITNSNTETISIPVTKKWIGNIGNTIETIVVKVKANGNEVATKNLTKDNGWKDTFTDLPKYDDAGAEIAYFLEEEVPNGYKSEFKWNDPSGMNDVTKGGTFTNTELTSVKVNKIWYPQTATTQAVTFVLKGGASDKSVTLDGSIDAQETVAWSYTFENLPKYRDGESTPIDYVVEEVAISGFESHRQKDNDGNYTFKNIEKTGVKVTKEWVGPAGTSAVVTLYKQEVGGRVKVDLGTENPVTLTLAKNWTHTFENLPKTDLDGNVINYLVDEEVPTGFEKDSTISYDASKGHVIINRNAATRKITVNKVWAHPAGTAEPEITVELLADGSVQGERQLSAGNSWTAEFSGLRKYAQTDGHEIKYLIREKANSVPNNYRVTITGQDANGVASDDATVTLTNTIFGKVSIGFTKKWLGAAADSITVHLFRQVGTGAKEVVGSPKVLTASDKWQYTFAGLDEFNESGQKYIYTMTEDNIPGYTSSIGLVDANIPNNFIAVNINDATIDIPVEKKWVNSSISEVTVRLYNGDKELKNAVLNEANKWKTVFTGLRKYSADDGSVIQYRVTEDTVPNFKTEITGDNSGFVVTNTYIPPIPPYVPEIPGGEGETPTPPTPPTPPTEENIPNEPTPEGEPNKPSTPPTETTPNVPVPNVPSVPEEEIPTDPVPQGTPELPKTSGVPAGSMHLLGMALATIGLLLKKKR